MAVRGSHLKDQLVVRYRVYRPPLLCVLTVTANSPPKFPNDMSVVSLPEDLPVGE